MRKKLNSNNTSPPSYFKNPKLSLIIGLSSINIALLLLWVFSFENIQIIGQLPWTSPLILEINFFLILFGLVINKETWIKIYKEIPSRYLFLLMAILIYGLYLLTWIAPRTHRIFYDEDIYINIAQNIVYEKKAAMCNNGENEHGEYKCAMREYNKEPNGWPYLLSIVFRLFRVRERYAFYLNNALFLFGIVIAFYLGTLLFQGYLAGIYAAFCFTIIPNNLRWFNTAAAEPGAAVFAALAILLFLIYFKEKKIGLLFLASITLPFSCQFRPESVLILPIIALIIILLQPKELTKLRTYLFAQFSFFLLIPHFVHLFVMREEKWGAEAVKFSFHYLKDNFRTNFFYYINNKHFPCLIIFFFAVGIIISEKWKEKAIGLVWFILFWGIFIFFYAGSYSYGTDDRFALVSFIPLALLAGEGISGLIKELNHKYKWGNYLHLAIFLILISSFLSFYPFTSAKGLEAWEARADHYYAKKMFKVLPANSIILTQNPNMFLVWGHSAGQASLATDNSSVIDDLFQYYQGGVFFHYNYWCNTEDPREKTFCKNILDKFNHKIIRSFKERNFRYILYKLERKK
ncbi:MAG: hypothetical protein V1872_10585 [bacterium]